MKNWRNSNLVKHNSMIPNKQKRSDPSNLVNHDLNNYILKTVNQSLTSQTSNRGAGDSVNGAWKETKDVPQYVTDEGLTPIYYDNGTVNVGSDTYLKPIPYSQIAQLETDGVSGDFGYSVTCSDDGKFMAYSSLNNSVEVFQWKANENKWSKHSTINYSNLKKDITNFTTDGTSSGQTFKTNTVNTDSNFGISINLSSNGNHLLIGCPGAQFIDQTSNSNASSKGGVYIVDLTSGTTRIILPVASTVNFGYSVFIYSSLFMAIGCPSFTGNNGSRVVYYKQENGKSLLTISNRQIDEGGSGNKSAGGYCLDAYVKPDSTNKYVEQFILLVGAPNFDVNASEEKKYYTNIGQTRVYYSNNSLNSDGTDVINICNSGYTVSDCGDNFNFGASVSIARQSVNNGKFVALIGAPNYTDTAKGNNFSTGKVYVCNLEFNSQGGDGINIDISYGIDNPSQTEVGCLGASVSISPIFNTSGTSDNVIAYSYFMSNPSSSKISGSNIVTNGKTTFNSVYNYTQATNGNQPTSSTLVGPPIFMGVPYNESTSYGFGFSIASSERQDLIISDPTIDIFVYNNRVQYSFYVNGPVYMKDVGFGTSTVSNALGNLQFGNIPSQTNGLLNIEGSSVNPFNTVQLKSMNTEENPFDTLYSEQSFQVIDRSKGTVKNLENLKIGSVTQIKDDHSESYMAFNNEFNIYNYKTGSGFEWVDNYSSPVELFSGLNNNGRLTEVNPVFTIKDGNVTINGDLDVNGIVSFKSADANTVGINIVYDNSNNDITTMILNQWVDSSAGAQNKNIFEVNSYISSTAPPNASTMNNDLTSLFSVGPDGVVNSNINNNVITNVSMSNYIPTATEFIQIAKFTSTATYGNIQITGSLRQKTKQSPVYYIKTIPVVDYNTGLIQDGEKNSSGQQDPGASSTPQYQYVYVVDANTLVTDGFVDVNIKVDVNNSGVVNDIDLSGMFAGECAGSKKATDTTDIFVANDSSTGETIVYMRVGKDTVSNLTVKYSGHDSAFNIEKLNTDPAPDSNLTISKVISLSGIGIISTLNNDNLTKIQNAEASASDGSISYDNRVEVSSNIRNNIMYNINGSLGLGLVPNSDLTTTAVYEEVGMDTQYTDSFSGQSVTTKSNYYKVVGSAFNPSDFVYRNIRNNFTFNNDSGTASFNAAAPIDPSMNDVTDVNGKQGIGFNMFGPFMAPFRLDISGNVLIRGVTNTANVTTWSDEKIKKNIETVDNALEKINMMRGVYYENVQLKNKKCIGVIAQEVEKVLPEIVTETNDLKSVSYNDIIGVLIESVKELSREVESLKEKLNS